MVIQADHTHAVDLLAAEHESRGEKKHTLSLKMYLTCTCKHVERSSGPVLDWNFGEFFFYFLATIVVPIRFHAWDCVGSED